jgi:arylamine N-acetyltransferase
MPGTAESYARLPDAFFDSAMALGTGGTCFESNYALRALLTALGFQCELAFCDMEKEIENPHCALTILLDDGLYLADVGYPIPAAFPLDQSTITHVDTGVYIYHAEPIAGNRWSITRTSGAFQQNNFVLKADPIDESMFVARLLRDHEPDGLFLHNMIVAKIFPTHILRFSEDRGLVRWSWGKEESVPLASEDQANLPSVLARLFGFDELILRAALTRTPLA